jgi:D-cysteine desulfhydrase
VTGTAERVALFRYLPQLATCVPWAHLGEWPTPLDEVRVDGRPIWVKREGDSSARYGGNKVRTLEAWLGHARAAGAERLWAIGAYGSNHAIATVIHARALGLDAGAIVFPQPASEWAIENASALYTSGCPIVRLHTVIEVPLAGLAVAVRDRWLSAHGRARVRSLVDAHWMRGLAPVRSLVDARWTRGLADSDLVRRAEAAIARALGAAHARRSIVMPPGGATPIGTLGALSAAFELAEQIAAGVAPPPRRIVLPVGSTCTTAGLVAGLSLARAIGVWRWPLPIVHAVRVTPWPVTSRVLIARLAGHTLARIARLGGPRAEIAARFVVDRRELGPGYGRVTERARAAMATLTGPDMPRLDGVYSAKAAAALLRLHREREEPLLFWSTKSTARLAPAPREALDHAPRALARWLASGELPFGR